MVDQDWSQSWRLTFQVLDSGAKQDDGFITNLCLGGSVRTWCVQVGSSVRKRRGGLCAEGRGLAWEESGSMEARCSDLILIAYSFVLCFGLGVEELG